MSNKTAITEVMDMIEMEHNNGVEISQKQLWKMLLKAKEKEKQQIIDFANKCKLVRNIDFDGNIIFSFDPEDYYSKTFEQ